MRAHAFDIIGDGENKSDSREISGTINREIQQRQRKREKAIKRCVHSSLCVCVGAFEGHVDESFEGQRDSSLVTKDSKPFFFLLYKKNETESGRHTRRRPHTDKNILISNSPNSLQVYQIFAFKFVTLSTAKIYVLSLPLVILKQNKFISICSWDTIQCMFTFSVRNYSKTICAIFIQEAFV